MFRKGFSVIAAVICFISSANAQKAEVTISLNEPFFDSLLDSIYQNYDPPEFPIAQNTVHRRDAKILSGSNQNGISGKSSFAATTVSTVEKGKDPVCNDSVRILREMNGIRTSVRFREGKVYVPLAFSGSYAAPFIGCVDFAGLAEANVELSFDQNAQKLIGRIQVNTVTLNGTGGVGSTVVAKMVQMSIDKKLNPIDILTLDKVSFLVPMQRSGNLRMKAVNMRPELANGLLNVVIEYQFLKG
ncbi:hypothetical protein BH10ACI3_BH10ACI3_16360 [soil metagenome]